MSLKQTNGVFNMTTMDRAYFKKKDTGKEIELLTKCCNTSVDDNSLNKNKPDDWLLIEEYCRRQLDEYPSTETITPICCKGCGKLLKYTSTVNDKAYYGKGD
tara:strand:- start:366 stop:671 length:306 start_codon:yes stop_codon:yes gene_type:complete